MERISEVVCPTCTAAVAARVSRNGFLQQNVLSHFGVYPWKCGACGSIFLSRNRGGRHPGAGRRHGDARSAEQPQERA
jgi:hypothetical protein